MQISIYKVILLVFYTADGSEYEVLYDEQFLGGLSIRGSRNAAYRHPSSCLINLSKRIRQTARSFDNQRITTGNTSDRWTTHDRHTGSHSTQQHVQKVLSHTEPLRTSSSAGKRSSIPSMTRKGGQQLQKDDQIKGYCTNLLCGCCPVYTGPASISYSSHTCMHRD